MRLPKTHEKPPFQTWAEIERQIQQGGFSEAEEAELWDCLFLTVPEVDELLAYVRCHATKPFIYPMFVFAAHTGPALARCFARKPETSTLSQARSPSVKRNETTHVARPGVCRCRPSSVACSRLDA